MKVGSAESPHFVANEVKKLGASKASTTTHTILFLERRHFGSLDGLRAIAILAVIWHHTGESANWLPMAARGFLGVDLFFVLSGFLITTLLLREQAGTGQINLKFFYMRRLLRIFPLYYGLLIVLSVASAALSGSSEALQEYSQNQLYYFTYTSNWLGSASIMSVAWSLAAEEQFYMVWPPIQKYLKRIALPILVIVLGINQLINFGILWSEKAQEIEILQITFTPICLGVGLAYLLNSRAESALKVFGNKLTMWATVLVLVVMLNLPSSETALMGLHRLVIHLLMTALIASAVVREDNVAAPFLKQRFVVRLGVLSYGLYLFHMLARHVAIEAATAFDYTPNPSLLFVLVLLLSLLMAEASFRFYETPFLGLKRRFASRATINANIRLRVSALSN